MTAVEDMALDMANTAGSIAIVGLGFAIGARRTGAKANAADQSRVE